MIDERIIKLALDFLLKFPDEGMNILNSDLCMPNIPFPTMGEYQGYKLQQNQLISIKKLYDQGIFTKEEFELRKQEILSQIK